MRLSGVIVLISIASGVVYGKLLHDREVRLAHMKELDDRPPPPRTPPPPPAPAPAPTPAVRPDRPPAADVDRQLVLTPGEEQQLEGPRALIASGRFEEAASACKDLHSSEDLTAAATRLGEKARLFATLTKAVQLHPFAGATDLVRVVLASGVTHTARILRESDSTVVLALADGRELEVRPERISSREKIAADGWAKDARAALEKERAALASDAGALEVYHVACEAFEVGARDVGTALLERSLGLEGGDAIIDVYGFGDLELLHRSQHRIRVDAIAAHPELVAEGRRPRVRVRGGGSPPPPPVRPVPAPQTSDVPPPSDAPPPTMPEPPAPAAPPEPPAPMPSSSTMDTEALETNAGWREAQDSYKLGVDAYRTGFNGRTAAEKQNLKRARTALEKARQLLDALPQDMTQDAAQNWDSFSARVNEILRAIKKQQAATGS
jgi:hypothetical protein